MKLIFFILYIICAWAQFDFNLCDPSHTCSQGEPCGQSTNYTYPSDRTGWRCDQGKCVAPQCSLIGQVTPNAFAPPCSAGFNCSSNFTCLQTSGNGTNTTAPSPVGITTSYLDFEFFQAGKQAGENCSQFLDRECSPHLYCNPKTLKCTEKVRFSPVCPASCNYSDECFEGICFNGTCARSGYQRNVGENCSAWIECFSGVCTNGTCTGVDCTNFNCTNQNYHCELLLNSTGSYPVCVPDYYAFNCNYSTHYPARVNVQTVQCVPKKAANGSCTNDYECLSNWCNPNGTCNGYFWNSIPVGRDCFTGFCAPGLYCNSNYTCAAYLQEGDLCNNTSECFTDLQCIQQNGTQRQCQRSPTIGKFCGWNSLGQHNCTVSFGESCVCFGTSTPRCVDVNSQEYHGRIQQSRQPLVTSSVGNVQLLNNAALKSSICQLASLGFDSDYASNIPSVLSGSYLRNKTGCNFVNAVPTLEDSVCRSQYAKYLCCSICSGLLEAHLSEYPNLNRNDKIFSGLYFGPIYTLTCGANPNITVNKDTCNGANVLSYNDIVNQLQCGSTFQPSYGLLEFNISIFDPSSLTQEYLEILILNYINSLGLPQPAVSSATVRSDNPFLFYVMIGYTGDSNNQTITLLSNSLRGSNFTNYLAQNNLPRASISAISIDSIIAPLFQQPSSEPLPNNLSPQPFPDNVPSSEPLPSTQPQPLPDLTPQPLPDNLSPEPIPQEPTTSPSDTITPISTPIQPVPTSPSGTITPISTPIQPVPTSPSDTVAPTPTSTSFAAKSVVVSMIILIASMVIGLSF